jgi:myo-inositol-1(or 4)-monophosphatase
MGSPYHNYLICAVEAAVVGGKILRDHQSKVLRTNVREKMACDFVTEVDHLSERAIIQVIRSRFPDHGILAEESGMADAGSDFCWVIDPLDGTKNYIHKIPQFSVSIALRQSEDTIVGAVYDPGRDELFTAERNRGAFLNGDEILVSPAHDLSDCLVATAFPFKSKDSQSEYYCAFSNLFRRISDFRRTGSAALDLAYVACGRLDGYWELGLKPWDTAAGALLVREAEGKVTDVWGGDTWMGNGHLLATNGNIHSEVVNLLASKLDQDKFRGHRI